MLQALRLGPGCTNHRERCSLVSHETESGREDRVNIQAIKKTILPHRGLEEIKQGGVVERDVRRLLCLGGQEVLSEVTLETS